jgi:hypothetical protein
MLIDPVATLHPNWDYGPGLARSVRGVAVANLGPRKSRPGSESKPGTPWLFYDSVGFRVALTVSLPCTSTPDVVE